MFAKLRMHTMRIQLFYFLNTIKTQVEVKALRPTLTLLLLAALRCSRTSNSNASIAGECSHGGVAEEGPQAVFVSGQDSNGF